MTGLQLPLISSGGTSLVVTMFVFGLLANAARHEPEAIAALRQQRAGRSAWPGCSACPPPQPYKAPAARRPCAAAGTAHRLAAREVAVADERVRPVVVAGGGSAGHIEPALAARRRRAPARARTHGSPRWAPSAAWTPRSSRRAATRWS